MSNCDYEYINENDIDDELKCVICKQPYECPVSLSICNHTFCKKCISLWLLQNPTCPICRNSSCEQSSYVPINTRIVLNQLDRLHVQCLLCYETNIQRCNWKNHKKQCSRRIVSCPSADIQCPWKGPRDALSIHLNNCIYQQIRPVIYDLANEMKLTRIKQIELKHKINVFEKQVTFLLQFINHGNLMTKSCRKPVSECKYNSTNRFDRNHQFICSLCNRCVKHEEISLHACSGQCICRSCISAECPDYIQYHNSSILNKI